MDDKQKLKVLYVEDAQESIDAIRGYLEDIGSYDVIKSRVDTLDAADQVLKTYNPDILLIDLDLPNEGPDKSKRIRKTAKYAAELRQRMPRLTILVHSGEDKLRSEVAAIIVAAGISYLTKEAVNGPEHLHRAIEHARTGGAIYDHQVVRFFDKVVSSGMKSEDLSPREWNVAALIEGRKNEEIAQHLNLSVARVNELVSSILRKKQFKNRSQIAVWYKEQSDSGNAPGPSGS